MNAKSKLTGIASGLLVLALGVSAGMAANNTTASVAVGQQPAKTYASAYSWSRHHRDLHARKQCEDHPWLHTNASLNDLAAGEVAHVSYTVENGVWMAHKVAVNPVHHQSAATCQTNAARTNATCQPHAARTNELHAHGKITSYNVPPARFRSSTIAELPPSAGAIRRGVFFDVKSYFGARRIGRRSQKRLELCPNGAQCRIVFQQGLVNFRQAVENRRIGDQVSRICMNARTTKTLIATAFGLFNTVAAMIAPCSVKAKGGYFAWRPGSKITICDLKAARPSLDTLPASFKHGEFPGGELENEIVWKSFRVALDRLIECARLHSI